MLVADIGQQYLDASTDTTRTFHFRPKLATKDEKRSFTRVLQGRVGQASEKALTQSRAHCHRYERLSGGHTGLQA
jgi:Xaa-Pro aminopeptidase